MATSNTFNFNPALGETVIYAYGLCGIRSTALLQEHMETARMATNMLLGRWSSQGVNLWAVDLQSIPLVQGTSTYSVPANTVVMLDAYVVQNTGTAVVNRILLPISRSEYATYPNPQMQGQPTVMWFDRLLSPTVTLWPVPDGNETSLNYYRMRQIQDAGFVGGQQVEVPVYFLEALAYGLAQRLALTYAPDRVVGLKALADEAYAIAADQNVETAQTYLTPIVSGYWRP